MALVTDAYAAGLFDGEGSVIINKVNARTHSLCCTMHLTDYDAISALHTKYGGSLNGVKRLIDTGRQMWSWKLSGQSAASFLIAVQPYLIIKGTQAAHGLAFFDAHRNALGLPSEEKSAEYARRERGKVEMHRLNGRSDAWIVAHGMSA